MIKKFINIVIFFFSIQSTELIAKIENKIVLKVENEIITNFEIKNKILSLLMISGQDITQDNINKYKKEVLNLLIDNKLKKIEVSKYNIKKNENKVNAYLKTITSDPLILKKQFSENNLDFQLYLDEITIEFMWQDLIYKLYSKKIDISKNTIENEITEYVNNTSSIEEFRISEFEILFENKEELEKKIFEIKNEIKEIGFEEIALKYNNDFSSPADSDLGWINSKSLAPEINKVLNEVQIGEITEPVIKQNSVIFLKLTDKRTSKKENIDMDKLKKSFINKKKNEQFDLYSKSHLSKLRNNSLIEYK